MCAAFLIFEGSSSFDNVVLDHIVTENNANLLTFNEGFGQTKSVCDASFALLVGVVNTVEMKILSIGEEAEEVTGILAASNDYNVLYTRVDQGLDRIEHHGTVVDGKKMLVRDPRERVET